MKRLAPVLFLAFASQTALAYPGPHTLSEDARPTQLRKGWTPYFLITLDDWGLRGPVKCLVARESKARGVREEHCFDPAGRILHSKYDDGAFSKQVDYVYDAGRLVRFTLRYENGQVSTDRLEYDGRGYLKRVVTESSGSAEAGRMEMEFGYDANGYLNQVRCATPRASAHCLNMDEELVVDARGRPRSSVAPNQMDLTAPLNLSAAPGGTPRTARMETRISYDQGNSAVTQVTYSNGRVFSTSLSMLNERGDIVLEKKSLPYGDSQTTYQYRYDKYENWTRREPSDEDGAAGLVIREISYGDGGR